MMVTQREMEHAVANNKVRAVEEKIATATANKEQQLQATQDSCNRRHRMWSIHVRNAAILQQTKVSLEATTSSKGSRIIVFCSTFAFAATGTRAVSN